MNLWKNTSTLDAFVPELLIPSLPEHAELAVIGSKPIHIEAMPRLRGIFKCGIGTDNVPFADAEKRGIKVELPSTETRRYILEETANFAVHLVFRMLYAHIGNVDNWEKRPRRFLGNRNVLIIGHGNIGRLVEEKLASFTKTTVFDAAFNSIDELMPLMRDADVVTLHIPLTENNVGFIDAEKLSWLQDGTALVNTSRGAIVSEDALHKEVLTGRIRAAFDVYWEEPYRGKLAAFHPETFLMTPHVASTCREFQESLAHDLRNFIRSF